MKILSIVLFLIGILLLFIQYEIYKANDFQFPSLELRNDFQNTVAINSGKIIGYNFSGLLGLLLTIIAMKID